METAVSRVRWTLPLLLMALVASACTAGEPLADPSGDWLLMEVDGEPVVSGVHMTIEGGRLSWRAGCTRYGADVTYPGRGRIEVSGRTGGVDTCGLDEDLPAASSPTELVHQTLLGEVDRYEVDDRELRLQSPVGELVYWELVDDSDLEPWSDRPSIEVGALTVAEPSRDQRVRLWAGDADLTEEFDEECRIRTIRAAAGRAAGGLAEACRSLAWPIAWQLSPSVDDQASEIIWQRHILVHACLEQRLGSELGEFPGFTDWVAADGLPTPEAYLPLADPDDDAVSEPYECLGGSEVPLPTGELPNEDPFEVVGELVWLEPCLLLEADDGDRWLPFWPDGHALLLLPQPGRLLFEVFDVASFEADVANDEFEPTKYTFLRPSTRVVLTGSASAAAIAGPEAGACAGAPFFVAEARPDWPEIPPGD